MAESDIEQATGPNVRMPSRSMAADAVDELVVTDTEGEEIRVVAELSATELFRALMHLGSVAARQTETIQGMDATILSQQRTIESQGRTIEELMEAARRLQGEVAVRDALVVGQDAQIALRDERIAALERESSIDEKTGLSSLKALESRRVKLVEQIDADHDPGKTPRRRRLQFTYLVADFDGFKDVNDQTNYATGDMLLRILGRRLREALREYEDALYRPHGDEIVIIMMGESLDEQMQATISERIDRVGKAAFAEFLEVLESTGHHEEATQLRQVKLTGYSVGVSVYSRRRHRVFDQVAAEAAAAMHGNKQARRDAAGLPPNRRSNIIPTFEDDVTTA